MASAGILIAVGGDQFLYIEFLSNVGALLGVEAVAEFCAKFFNLLVNAHFALPCLDDKGRGLCAVFLGQGSRSDRQWRRMGEPILSNEKT
ncbi:protein of unknown function (plasmid) [Methylocella tundrae]|uniref:Uncharacterized protein n=1 Tax=Methylocella tundrae TaxID=227605 RepID=A0A4V6IN94_METTU|nr:protein of unknown function [Methylocella tundrae]